MKNYAVGQITQLSNEELVAVPTRNWRIVPLSKSQIIDALKRYLEDYEVTNGDNSMQNVIDWFINCTPDYDESK